MARPIPMAERARGLLVGLARGHAGPDGGEERLTGEGALAAILAEELLESDVDLRRLAERWIAWGRHDGRRLSARTVEALEHLGRYDAPMGPGPGTDDAGPLVRMLPIAIVTARQPRNLVSGTWHTVMLTHPDPALAWTAVAVNVAAAQLLRGHRDFLPDVIEALQANDAAGKVLSAIRRLPFVSITELDGGGVVALAAAEAALWTAHHEFRVERAFAGPAAGPSDQAALIGALLGAREGEQGLPVAGMIPESERLRSLAKRLATPRPAT